MVRLGREERMAIEALMSQPVAPVSPSSNTGTTATTITRLLGVVRHVFKFVAKPFVVCHEELNRTIRYTIDDLRMES
jgi:hypothetical protein